MQLQNCVSVLNLASNSANMQHFIPHDQEHKGVFEAVSGWSAGTCFVPLTGAQGGGINLGKSSCCAGGAERRVGLHSQK